MKHPQISAAAKALIQPTDVDQAHFVAPVKITYRRLELLGHGVFGVVYSVRVSNVHVRSEEIHAQSVDDKLKIEAFCCLTSTRDNCCI